ncbi:M23 family metallopeptidase [Kribbella deserti]|uniref:M23 family metallopeptidase n=1 Tax=Kribbella deserti TaxID=1926257 RepID=A0ABV6QUQ4_9ACTN
MSTLSRPSTWPRPRPPSRLLPHFVRCSLFLLAVFSAQATSPLALAASAEDVPRAVHGWPLTPRPEVVRGFEPPPAPWLAGHRGVDLAGAPGQPVLAPTAGRVTFAGAIAGRGVVVLTHGRSRTTYEPVVATVRVGQPVTPGQPIGRLSAAGSHCAPAVCLHWGLLKARQYADPLSLVRHPVRLLPLPPPSRPPTGADARLGSETPTGGGSRSGQGLSAGAAERGPGPAAVERGVSAGGGSERGFGHGAAGALAVGLAAAAVIGGGLAMRRH